MQYPSVYTLIVAGAPSGVPASLLSGLVAKASYVIAADSGAVSLEAAGLLPDILVGDMDSIPAAVLAAMEEAGVPLRQVPARKDFTDLELALDVARERGTTNLVLCGVTGGRLDQQLAVLGDLIRAVDLNPLLVDRDELVFPLSAAVRPSVRLAELGLEPGHTFSVLSACEGTCVSETGVRYPLCEHNIEVFSGLGVSNVMESADAVVTCHSGALLVMVSR